MQKLSNNKTKLVCTIGPASNSLEMIEKFIESGMNIARINFSHGDFASHDKVIKTIRSVAERKGKTVAIMADLPGPKMRIGDIEDESVSLKNGACFILTAKDIAGNSQRVSITMKELSKAVTHGNTIFLNDGLIELRVDKIIENDIHCTVIVGGQLRSRKGINIPGIDLGTSAFTTRDCECMQFALEHGVDAIGQSFVSTAKDVHDVRDAAQKMGFDPFIIAKIERSNALENIDEILEATDGVMVARGDLGVEIPIEEIATAQKMITARANFVGKPVITATQMLESMTENRRPTRAEATDVANAILDGTDCVMLSEESAIGAYPLESVQMLAKIATVTEQHRPHRHFEFVLQPQTKSYKPTTVDLIAKSIEEIFSIVDSPSGIIAPTSSGYMARSLTRSRLPVWIIAVSTSLKTCRDLMFSYGVYPVLEENNTEDWTTRTQRYVKEYELQGTCLIKAEGPSPDHPGINHKMEIIALQ